MPNKRLKKRIYANLKNSYLLAIALAFIFLALGVFTYAQVRDDSVSDTTDSNTATNKDDNYINLDPPTEEEKKSAEDHKNSLADEKPASTTPGSQGVTVTITNASRSEVNAYVTGVFEDGGHCTATATMGSQTKTATSEGFTNVSYTSCAPIKWSLPSGNWSVVVSYSSSKASGHSEAVAVN